MRQALLFIVVLFLAGCGTAPLRIPPVPPIQGSVSPFELEGTDTLFAMSKVVVDVKRGENILAFPTKGVNFKQWNCNIYSGEDSVLTWSSGRSHYADWSTELGRLFFEVLTDHGYTIAGDPTDLFGESKSVRAAQYMVGARVLDVKSNFCAKYTFWTGIPLSKYSGESYVLIEWSIYDVLEEKIVFKKQLPGYFKQQDAIREGILLTLYNAFSDSLERLAREHNFKQLALGKKLAPLEKVRPTGKHSVKNGKSSKKFDAKKIRTKIVLIKAGSGHGSGFFVGKKGHLLTNAHVVGKSTTFLIRTASGLELEAKLLAKNVRQDVALLQVPLGVQNPLHLNLKLPEQADDVYVIGAPVDPKLQSTVTKGVVSAIREYAFHEGDDKTYIQSDVSISGGNSGGPMLNANGSVIGIVMFKRTDGDNLNFFIPLERALSALGISIQ